MAADDELEGWTEERLEAWMNVSGFGMRASALEDLRAELKTMSGNLFQERNDAKARYVRDELIPVLDKKIKILRDMQTDARLEYERIYER